MLDALGRILGKALDGLAIIGPIAVIVGAVLGYRLLCRLLDKWGFVEDPKEKKRDDREDL